MERYNNEVNRPLGVIEGALDGKQWLVGDKCTFAELAFVTWNDRLNAVLVMPEGRDKFEKFPNIKGWHERMTSRPSWKNAMESRAKLMDEQGLQWNGMPKAITNMKEYEEK